MFKIFNINKNNALFKMHDYKTLKVFGLILKIFEFPQSVLEYRNDQKTAKNFN